MAYKLAVLFHEPETEGKDLSRPELGNPGVGGTAYCFAMLLQALEAKGNVEIFVYSVQNVTLPVENFVKVESALEGLRAAEKNAHRTVLLRNHQEVFCLRKRQGLHHTGCMVQFVKRNSYSLQCKIRGGCI